MNAETRQLEFETAQAGDSQNAKMLEALTTYRGQWVPLPYLVDIGCGYATHSRAADLRKRGHDVQNMVDRSTKPYRSFYRLTA